MSQISTKWIEDQAVTKDKLNVDVAGNGINGGGGTALNVKPDVTTGATVAPAEVGANGVGVKLDDTTVGHTAGTVGVKDGGIDTTQLADSAVTNIKLAGSISDDKLAESYIKADGTRAFTGDQSMGSNKLTGVAAGTDPTDGINKSQLDAGLAGLSWKEPVDEQALAPTGNEAGIDGFRVLINGTGTGAFAGQSNAIATWDDGGSSWSFEAPGANWAVFDKATDNGYTYDADTTSWIQFTGATNITAGAGLTKSGSVLDVGQNTTGGITVNADDIALNVDNTTVEVNGTAPGVVRVKPDGIGATEIDESATLDFATGGGTVQVTTQLTGDNTTKAASTAFVQQEISAISIEQVKTEAHVVSSGESTAGYFTLSQVPVNAQSVTVYPARGPGQVNKQIVGATGITPDFDILNTNEVHINNNGGATGLSGHISTNDELVIVYHF